MATEYKTGDSYPPIRGTVKDNTGAAVAISTATTVRMIAKRVGGTETVTGATVKLDDGSTPLRGRWEYQLATSDLAVAGDYEVELEVTWPGGKIETFPDNQSRNPVITVSADLD
jgi:hypothetical protein